MRWFDLVLFPKCRFLAIYAISEMFDSIPHLETISDTFESMTKPLEEGTDSCVYSPHFEFVSQTVLSITESEEECVHSCGCSS